MRPIDEDRIPPGGGIVIGVITSIVFMLIVYWLLKPYI